MKRFLTEKDTAFLQELSQLAEMPHEQDIYSRAGYEILGPMLLGYSAWLHRQIEQTRADKVVFLAREGRILKAAYEQIYGTEGTGRVYLHVSRKALWRASIINTKSWDDVEDLSISILVDVITVGESLKLLTGWGGIR